MELKEILHITSRRKGEKCLTIAWDKRWPLEWSITFGSEVFANQDRETGYDIEAWGISSSCYHWIRVHTGILTEISFEDWIRFDKWKEFLRRENGLSKNNEQKQETVTTHSLSTVMLRSVSKPTWLEWRTHMENNGQQRQSGIKCHRAFKTA